MRKITARWIRHTHVFRRDEYECSACGGQADRPYKTCPHCAAAMGGSEYDPSWVDELEIMDAIFGD